VLGLSGGIDSALVAFLVADVVGAPNLLCLMLPYRTSSPASRRDAEEVVGVLGCRSAVIDITPIVDGYFAQAAVVAVGPDGADARGDLDAAGDPDAAAARLRLGNFAARARMAVLYDQSAAWRALVMGTSNKTETLLGYTTIFGDNAAALQPIADLYKSQVRQLSAAVGVPEQVLRKPPTADLWAGQTDEAEVGLAYAEIDRLLYWLVDRRRTADEVVELGFDRASIERVERLVAGSEFKRQPAPIAKLSPRTPGVDYLYPRRRPRPR
jgi:NAD+ synthase